MGGGAAVSGRRFEPWGGLPWGRSAAGRSGAGPQVRALQIGGRTSLPLALPGSIVVAGDQSSVTAGSSRSAVPLCPRDSIHLRWPIRRGAGSHVLGGYRSGPFSVTGPPGTAWRPSGYWLAGYLCDLRRFLARRVLHGAPAVPWPAGYLCDLRRLLARRVLHGVPVVSWPAGYLCDLRKFLARRVLHGAPAVPWPAGYLCDLRRFLARRVLGRSAAAFCPMLLAAPARPPDPAPLLQSTLFGAFRAPEGPVCGPSVCPLRYRSGPFAGRSCARARCARPSFPVQAVTRPHADRQSARASSALA